MYIDIYLFIHFSSYHSNSLLQSLYIHTFVLSCVINSNISVICLHFVRQLFSAVSFIICMLLFSLSILGIMYMLSVKYLLTKHPFINYAVNSCSYRVWGGEEGGTGHGVKSADVLFTFLFQQSFA